MGIPLAALAIQPPPDPLRQIGQALAIKGAVQNQQYEQQARPLELQQRQQQAQLGQMHIADEQAKTQALNSWDGKDLEDLPGLVLKHGGSATAVFGLRQQIQEQKKQIAQSDEATLNNIKSRNDLIAGHIESVKGADDKPAAFDAAISDLEQKGIIKPGTIPHQYPGDDKLNLFEKQFIGQKALVDQDLQNRAEANKEKTQALEEKKFEQTQPGGALENPEQRFIRLQAKQNQGQPLTAEEKSQLNATKQYKELVPAFNFNLANNTGAATGKSPADVAKQFGMTPEAFDQAAEKYYQTGNLPPIGRGGQGQALQKAIMNRTGELHGGASLAEGSAEYKANADSLKKLQGNLDSVSAFESTALKNLQLFRNQAQKVIDTGIPLLNAPLRSAAKMLGSQDQAGFETALQVANNEIAKVTSSPGLSGVLSDSARKEVEAYNPKNATIGQAMHVADILTQDMANRHQSYQQQINDIKGRMGGRQPNATTPSNTSTAGAPQTADDFRKKHNLP